MPVPLAGEVKPVYLPSRDSMALDVTERAQGRVGTVLKDKWRIDALIGVGGMAVVYRATHRNGKEVAIKMLHPEVSLDASIRDRFLREGYAANRVKHRSAVTVDDDDVTDDGAAFLVMEFLRGETLDGRLTRLGGRLPPDEVVSLMGQVLDALSCAHEQGIVHRDLKPDNLFLTTEGVLKILDFGIARLRETAGNSSATQTGTVMGTPAFMPPEQARGRWSAVDGRTDIWAVGATMFTLLTGQHVHAGESMQDVLVAAATEPSRPIETVMPRLHKSVCEVVNRALAFKQEERFADALTMQMALRLASAELSRASGHSVRGQLQEPFASARTLTPAEAFGQPVPELGSAATAAGVSASTAIGKRASLSPLVIAGTVVLLLAGGGIALISSGDAVDSSLLATEEAPTASAVPAVQPPAGGAAQTLAGSSASAAEPISTASTKRDAPAPTPDTQSAVGPVKTPAPTPSTVRRSAGLISGGSNANKNVPGGSDTPPKPAKPDDPYSRRR